MKTYSELQKLVHQTAIDKGWHCNDELNADGFPTARQLLAWSDLVTDELDEAELETLDEYSDTSGKPCGYLTEIVDARIRLMDMAGACKINLDSVANINSMREYPPLRSLCAERNAWRAHVRRGTRAGVEIGLLRYLLCIDRLFSERMSYIRPGLTDGYITKELERITLDKDEYNRTKRSYRHGGKLA